MDKTHIFVLRRKFGETQNTLEKLALEFWTLALRSIVVATTALINGHPQDYVSVSSIY